MNAKLNANLPDTIPPPAPESEAPQRQGFERRPKGERVPSGKQLPPPPSWMVKPLKPPRSRPPTGE
jgi:hypothetical protein